MIQVLSSFNILHYKATIMWFPWAVKWRGENNFFRTVKNPEQNMILV